jgi:hypothetical protein
MTDNEKLVLVALLLWLAWRTPAPTGTTDVQLTLTEPDFIGLPVE